MESNNDWNSVTVIYELERDKNEVYFLMQWAKSLNPLYSHLPEQLRLFGGGRREGDQNPLDTAVRELGEESGLYPYKGYDPVVLDERFFTHHSKHSYLYPRYVLCGKVRQGPIVDGDTELGDVVRISSRQILDIWKEDKRRVARRHFGLLMDATSMILNVKRIGEK